MKPKQATALILSVFVAVVIACATRHEEVDRSTSTRPAADQLSVDTKVQAREEAAPSACVVLANEAAGLERWSVLRRSPAGVVVLVAQGSSGRVWLDRVDLLDARLTSCGELEVVDFPVSDCRDLADYAASLGETEKVVSSLCLMPVNTLDEGVYLCTHRLLSRAACGELFLHYDRFCDDNPSQDTCKPCAARRKWSRSEREAHPLEGCGEGNMPDHWTWTVVDGKLVPAAH